MKLWRRVLLGLACLPAVLAGCRPAPPAPVAEPPWFEDVTDAVGLHFTHDAGPVDGKFFLPQVVGSGAAFFDFDGDGLLDVYLVNNGGPHGRRNVLYRQLPGGTFEDVSAGSGLDVAGYGMGVAVGDANNDGRPDVLLTEYGRVRLFLNQGNGKFTDATRAAGLDNPLWATGASFFDFDRDGWPDLVVVNYVDHDSHWRCGGPGGAPDYCNPNQFAGSAARLFRNRGPKAAGGWAGFEDVSLRAGLGQLPGPGLGVVCADFDGDGWPDIFVANDGQPNRLWVNRRDGTFAEEAVSRGLACNGLGKTQANMGVALGAVHDSGTFDVFVTHLTEETNTLWVQNPRGLFQDRTAVAGLAGPAGHGTGWGTVLGDFDNDGALDLAVVNGRVSRGPPTGQEALGPHWARYAERNQLFSGGKGGLFRDVSPHNAAFCAAPGVYRGLAVGDVNGDGGLDLLVTAVNGRARLYRNVAPRRGHWLVVRAVEAEGKYDALGATVTVRAGARRWSAWVNPGQSYLCSHDPRAHFGLGAASRVDAVEVVWPDGTTECFPGTPADRTLLLVKGRGTKGKNEGARRPGPLPANPG